MPSPPPASKTDQRLAAAALEKLRTGGKPTQVEARALKKYQAARGAEEQDKLLRNVPKKLLLEMAGGRQATTVIGMAKTWGMPTGGRTVDMFALVRWIFDFLAENAQTVRQIREGADSSDPGKRADTRYKQERTRMIRSRRREQQGNLLSRADVHDGLLAIAGIYRRGGQRLRRQFGEDAYQIVEETWDDAQRKIDSLFGPKDAKKTSKAKTKGKPV